MRVLSLPVVVLLLAAAARDHRALRESLPYDAMMELLAELDSPVAQVETIGTSTEGRATRAVHLRRPGAVRRAGRDWVGRAVAPMRERGHRYGRYLVGSSRPGGHRSPNQLPDSSTARLSSSSTPSSALHLSR